MLTKWPKEPNCSAESRIRQMTFTPETTFHVLLKNQASQVISINKSGTAAEMQFTSQELC